MLIPTTVLTQAVGTVAVVTSLSASPSDGQEEILVDSLTAPTYAWRFRYTSGVSDANKWLFVGGDEVVSTVSTDQSSSSTGAWLDLATVGPTFTVPRAGDYDVRFGWEGYNSVASSRGLVGVAVGATSPSVAFHYFVTHPVAAEVLSYASNPFVLSLSASDALRVRYFLTTAGTANFRNRMLRVLPRRVA